MRRFIIVCHVAMLLLHVCDNKKFLVQVADPEPSVGEGFIEPPSFYRAEHGYDYMDYEGIPQPYQVPKPKPSPATCNCGMPSYGSSEPPAPPTPRSRRSRNRIALGFVTSTETYPWIVWIREQKEKPKKASGCTGSLLDPRHVLTAGHCGDVEERGPGGGKRWSEIDPEKLTVHPGLDDKKKARRSNGVTVAKIHLHPTYKAKGTQGSDLAILTLASSLTYTPTIQPACLPADPGQSYIGVVAMVAGFGRDENDKYQKDLEKTDVTTFDGAQCDEMGWHAARLKRGFWQHHLCAEGAAAAAAGIREGDSGGGLNYREHGRYAVIAVSSFIHKKTPGKVPDVYSKITPQVKRWIQKIAIYSQDSDCGQ